MRAVSKKRADRREERDHIVARVMIKYPSCIMDSIFGTYTTDRDPDELILRSEWPDGIYVFENVIALGRNRHHIKHHMEPEAAMIVGLYGPDRMRRYDIPVEERLSYLQKFDSRPVIESAGKTFLWSMWNKTIPGWPTDKIVQRKTL